MQNSLCGEIIFTEAAISKGVSLVAQAINRDFSEVVVISVVPGGILFTADLVRQLSIDVKMDYISCPHTPGDRNNDSAIVFHNNIALAGQDVLLIDDAIESGGTMKRLVEFIQSNFQVSSLAVATLFVKANRCSIATKQYYAYEIENDGLMIGYGLPWQDKHRNLPFVATLKT